MQDCVSLVSDLECPQFRHRAFKVSNDTTSGSRLNLQTVENETFKSSLELSGTYKSSFEIKPTSGMTRVDFYRFFDTFVCKCCLPQSFRQQCTSCAKIHSNWFFAQISRWYTVEPHCGMLLHKF